MIKLWNSWDWPCLITHTLICVTCGVSTYGSTPSIATPPAPNYSDSADCCCAILTDRKWHQSVRGHRVSLYQIFSHLRVKEKTEKHKNQRHFSEENKHYFKSWAAKPLSLYQFFFHFNVDYFKEGFLFSLFQHEYLNTTRESGWMNDLSSIHKLQLLF